MPPAAFVYAELHGPDPVNSTLGQPGPEIDLQGLGLLDITLLSDNRNNTSAGFYTFADAGDATLFATKTLSDKARSLGVTYVSRLFDAPSVRCASLEMNSPHFAGVLAKPVKAFVYAEMQVSVPFENAPWRDRNPVLKTQPGLLAKTWLSGLRTNTLGGFYAFDSVETAWAYALDVVPKTAIAVQAAPYTRVFNASQSEEANRYSNSPYFD
ncbi:hypothetical protein [Parasedimentitalea marina]|nr:hypothetical protein [Parasedimentitalea marina]